MKKKTAILLIILTVVIGSFVTFYATNLLFSDLSNMFYGVHDAYIVSSIPLFMIALDFTLLFLYLMRLTRHPERAKSLGNLYSVYLGVNSVIGLVTAVITGAVIYKDFLARYPFGGYTLIMIILHVALVVLAVYLNVKNRKHNYENQEKRKIGILYVLYNVALGIFVYYAFNKFGVFIWSPTFIYWRTFNLTFPFFLSMLCPIAVLSFVTAKLLGAFDGREKQGMITMAIIFGVSLALSISVLVIGYTHTQFISAVSPALPLERLATMPINSVFQLCATLVVGGYCLFDAIRFYKRSQK